MDLSIDSLQKSGGFLGPPVKKSVEWTADGEKVCADVWIRPISYADTLNTHGSKSTGEILAHRLAKCVCHADGSPVFQFSDITGYQEDGAPVMIKVDGKKVERGPLNRELTENLSVLVLEVSGKKT